MSRDESPWVSERLTALRNQDRLRSTVALEPVGPVEVHRDGRSLLVFSANDYLGLATHGLVRQAASQAAQRYGMGPRGATLVCGHTHIHAELEAALADLKQSETALLFPSGYQANVGVLSALGTPDTTIFSDALNHASIIDGCRLARARVTVFNHADPEDLERKLRLCPSPRKIVVTDEIFSMDGDHAPLQAIAALKEQHDFIWVTDSAHSTLVFGPNGGGLAEAAGVSAAIDYQVGTLSKAIGAQGGFVATSHAHRSWLLNSARPFVFSTALPIPILAAARAALSAAQDGVLRETLWRNIRYLSSALAQKLSGPIVPLMAGSESAALALSKRLMDAGIHAPAIRPPTVPDGTCRVRIALSAAHSLEDLDSLAAAVKS